MKKLKNLFVSLLALTIMLTSMPMTVSAAVAAPSCVSKQTVYVQKAPGYTSLEMPSNYICIKNLSSKASVTNVKSSNKKILAQHKKMVLTGQPTNMIELTQDIRNGALKVKSGEKTRISFTVKQNGKSYKLYCDVTFKYADSPFKNLTLKYGSTSKEYASLFKGYELRTFTKPKESKMKFYAAPSAGHKISKVIAAYIHGDRYESKSVKNGSWISTKDLMSITIIYSTTKAPANYKKPVGWRDDYHPTPLHDTVTISYYQ